MAEEMEEQIEAAEEAGNVTKLLDIISSCSQHGGDDDWTEVSESSLDAFYRLVKGGAATSSNGAPETCLQIIFSSLEAWKAEEAIVEVALGCIVALVSKSTNLTKTDTVNVSLLVELMKDFDGEVTIQEQACLAIEGLARSSHVFKDAIKAVDGIKGELSAAKQRITNERNKAYPGRAATALGIDL